MSIVHRPLSFAILAAGTAAVLLAATPLIGQRLLEASSFNAPTATALCPWVPNYWAYLAEIEAPANPATARQSYLRAIRLSPRTAGYHARLGLLFILPCSHAPMLPRSHAPLALHKSRNIAPTSAETDIGLAHLERACELDRYCARYRLWLARASFETGRTKEARRHVAFCIEHCRPTEPVRKAALRLLDEIERGTQAGADDEAQGERHNCSDAPALPCPHAP